MYVKEVDVEIAGKGIISALLYKSLVLNYEHFP